MDQNSLFSQSVIDISDFVSCHFIWWFCWLFMVMYMTICFKVCAYSLQFLMPFTGDNNYSLISYSQTLTGPGSFNILEGHSKATMFLICNNAAQGILSSFFFKYAGKLEQMLCFLCCLPMTEHPYFSFPNILGLFCFIILILCHSWFLQTQSWKNIHPPLLQFLLASRLLLYLVIHWPWTLSWGSP